MSRSEGFTGHPSIMHIKGILVAVASAAIVGQRSVVAAAARLPLDQQHVSARLAPRHIPSSHVVHERLEARHTEGWARRELADAKATLPMRIGLAQANLDKGQQLLMDM